MIEHVLFLRHFETAFNVQQRICGQSPEIEVFNCRNIDCHMTVDYAFCSPAKRCIQTMEALMKETPIPSIFYDPALMERNMGRMEGQLRSEMATRYSELFCNGKFRVFETPPDGETFEEFYARAKLFWERISATYSGTVLICSHNQLLKMLYFVIREKEITEAAWSEFFFANGKTELIF